VKISLFHSLINQGTIKMNMDFLLKRIFALFASIFVSGCDQRHTVEDNLKPFSFIGVQLGMKKNVAAAVRTIGECRPEGIDVAVCSIGRSGEKYRFFGISVESGNVSLFNPYSQISAITFYTKWDILQKKVVETSWGLQGRCLDEWGLSELIRSGMGPGDNFFIGVLQEAHLLPSGPNFVCLSKNREFIQVFSSGSPVEGRVDIAYLNEVYANSFEHIFNAKAALDARKDNISKIFDSGSDAPSTSASHGEQSPRPIPEGWRAPGA
jgi:hypothetical protein